MSHDHGVLKYPNLNILGASTALIKNGNQSQKIGDYVNFKELFDDDDSENLKSS